MDLRETKLTIDLKDLSLNRIFVNPKSEKSVLQQLIESQAYGDLQLAEYIANLENIAPNDSNGIFIPNYFRDSNIDPNVLTGEVIDADYGSKLLFPEQNNENMGIACIYWSGAGLYKIAWITNFDYGICYMVKNSNLD